MRKETRKKFNAYCSQIAKLNDVENVAEKFAVTPSVQQTLEERIQQSSSFLQLINIVTVVDQEGEKIGIGCGTTIAGTTDTTQRDRVPVDPTDMTGNKYKCEQINSDTALRYAKIDAWARQKNFQKLIQTAIIKQQGRDRILIGFNGTRRAANSDRAANPKLQDVGKGWIQKWRDEAPARVMNKGKVAGKITVGKVANVETDYKNLDALVMDAANHLIDEVYLDDPELVVIVGRGLMADKYFPLVNEAKDNTDALAADLIISQKRIGGFKAVQAPGFPANTVLVTRLDNLSIYVQEGSRRRNIVDNSKRDQIENYESSNDDYVVEDFRAGCVIENIEVVEEAA